MEVASIDTATTAPPDFSLYQFDGFDPTDATGFIRVNALRLRSSAIRSRKRDG